MPTSTLGELEPYAEEFYPSALLKYLLKQMMIQFTAQGACIALYDESSGLMKTQMHVRWRNSNSATSPARFGSGSIRVPKRHTPVHLASDTSPSLPAVGRTQPLEELDEVTPQQSELFPVGATIPLGEDLIGRSWLKNEAYVMSHEEYLDSFYHNGQHSLRTDVVPDSYLAVPIQETTPFDGIERKYSSNVLGVIVLYRVTSGIGSNFQQKQRAEALQYTEHVTLYLQNERLRRSQQHASRYLQLLQEISCAFPTSLKLSDLVENIYQFATQMVNVSSMLLTLYDRDTEKLYDVFAIRDGKRIEGLTEQPIIKSRNECPTWWQVVQNDMRTLQFSPAQDVGRMLKYEELLTGTWGDQRRTRSFLLLPMTMFNRAIGSLCLATTHAKTYHPEEILALETMMQIVAVSTENVKLYEQRDWALRQEANRHEAELAGIVSALQAISPVLNVAELLKTLVEEVAKQAKANLCAFFQLSPTKEELIAHAIYAPTTFSQADDGSELPAVMPPHNPEEHDELINRIKLRVKGTSLEQFVNNEEQFFYLDTPQLEEIAQESGEGGAIFLGETHVKQMLMIPMNSQRELIGILAIPTPGAGCYFPPKDIFTIKAICAQATSAIRNAQLYEEREVAYTELQRMSKLKDEFLVTVSHELRTPLTAISGYASLLKRQSSRISPSQILRFATLITGAAQQLSDQVGKMTAAVQIGAVDQRLDSLQMGPTPVLVAAEISRNMLSFKTEQKIALQVDPNLWVQADAVRLRQVLTNLLENATKYAPHGQIILSASPMTLVQVAEILPDDQIDHAQLVEAGDLQVVLIRVQDEGEGILPEDQKRIFEKFVRAPRSITTPVRGSGLGLWLCRRYVEIMGGKLCLEKSIPGKGSTFSFYLLRTDALKQTGEQDENEYQTP